MQGYQGIFFNEEIKNNLIKMQGNGALEKNIENIHVTFYHGEIFKFPDNILGKNYKVKVIGYASNGINSGFEVELPKEVLIYFKKSCIPHITVSLGIKDGIIGKAVDTENLNFKPIEVPFEIEGMFGYYLKGKGVILNNDIFK